MNGIVRWFCEDDEPNPFASPQSTEGADFSGGKGLSADDKCRLLGQLFWRWEKLRVVFNAVLTLEVVVLFLFLAATGPTLIGSLLSLRTLVDLVAGCLAANLFFLLGHYINAYLFWLGFRRRIYTAIIFLAGLAIAVVLAAGVAVSHQLPGMG
jgi:small-conductance mechanosensitive channel